ncbi:hypothetical protein B0T11DRAFT_289776 [Plectosphaerella cucumerina]|uniref:Uncharacterized protein n=1 Tax=Plectosphaerella cucumerina TaxID=40658 RepID=A0A8K0T6E4_9PEZI|nr:hypothetical protein B0T11DRAFT_289776 [Plectosphaerella cucumerina]
MGDGTSDVRRHDTPPPGASRASQSSPVQSDKIPHVRLVLPRRQREQLSDIGHAEGNCSLRPGQHWVATPREGGVVAMCVRLPPLARHDGVALTVQARVRAPVLLPRGCDSLLAQAPKSNFFTSLASRLYRIPSAAVKTWTRKKRASREQPSGISKPPPGGASGGPLRHRGIALIPHRESLLVRRSALVQEDLPAALDFGDDLPVKQF